MIRSPLLAITLSACAFTALAGQGVVVDQGQFSVQLRGRPMGTEVFVIRRAGRGRVDAIFANGTVSMREYEVRPLLRADPPAGEASSYQVSVTGQQAIDIRLAKDGRRYVATVRSAAGSEDREFQARPETRVVELGVAHHYYFLRSGRPGRPIPVLEPRSRRLITLTPSEPTEVELQLGPNLVDARRVEFASDEEDDRIVWFDRQGRVLRVEVPSAGYVAERTDLVG